MKQNGIHKETAILGGGMAGLQAALSIATHLSGTGQRVRIFEPRSAYSDDRTFCYWNVAPIDGDSIAQHRWSKWRVQAGGKSVVAESKRYTYNCVPGEAFYRRALEKLSVTPNVELLAGTTVSRVQASPRGRGLRITTNRQTTDVDVVYDTRPSPELVSKSAILQHFVGWHIAADRPVFDEDTVTLMDFDVSQEHGLHFMYVLPFSKTEALIESTFFSPAVHEASIYEGFIQAYLKERYGLGAGQIGDFQLVRKEGGVVPMTTSELASTTVAGWYRLGTVGGFVRPATGYSFHQTCRWIDSNSKWLARPVGTRPKIRSVGLNWLDSVLLSFLLHRPEDAPEIFLGLFERVPPDALVRFLSDVGTIGDTLRVMLSMPVMPFVKEAMRLGRITPLQIRESASGSM